MRDYCWTTAGRLIKLLLIWTMLKFLADDIIQFFCDRIISFVYPQTALNGAQYDDCGIIPCYLLV